MLTQEATQGLVPEFVNPKYADDSRTVFTTPTRLECMMQDLPRLYTHPDARVAFVKMDRWISYTPVKNGVKEGAQLAAKRLPPMTAATGEAHVDGARVCMCVWVCMCMYVWLCLCVCVYR